MEFAENIADKMKLKFTSVEKKESAALSPIQSTLLM